MYAMTKGVNNEIALLLLQEREAGLPDDIARNRTDPKNDDAEKARSILSTIRWWERPAELQGAVSGAKILTALKSGKEGTSHFDFCLDRDALYALMDLTTEEFSEEFGDSKVCAFRDWMVDDETGDVLIPYLIIHENSIVLRAKRLASEAWDASYKVAFVAAPALHRAA